MSQRANCYDHPYNMAYILCTGNCLKSRPWICAECKKDHNQTKIGDEISLDPQTHAHDKSEFYQIKQGLIEDINKRPQQLQLLLSGYHKIQEILSRIANYIQQNQKNMQEYVDDFLRKMKDDLKFVQQLNFDSVNTEQAEQINKIRQSRFINPSEYYKSSLRRDLYKLIDLYKDALQQTEAQVRDYFQEQPQSLQSQQIQNTQRIVNTTCISISHDEIYLASGTCGTSLGRLDIFEVLSQNCIAKLHFQDVITTVSFRLKKSDQQFIYELAVCTKKYIQFCVLNIKDKKLQLANQQIQYNYKKYGQIIKFIYLNQFEYIAIGEKLAYFSQLEQPDKIIDTITVTDIDVSLEENRILIGNKQGFVKFQELEQNNVVVFFNQPQQMTQAHNGHTIVCVKIRQTNNNQQQGNRYLTAGSDDLIKIWNFQNEIKSQIKVKCNTASFIGNSKLLAIFNKKEFEIGVFYEIDEYYENNENKVSYERIKRQPLHFDKEYLNKTKILQNIGIVIMDNCFIQTITRDNQVQRYLDDAVVCLKFQKKQIIQVLEISSQDTQLLSRWSRQPSVQQDFQKQV